MLEQLRLLTNLETDTRKLLQIVLIGQPELRDRLAEPAMEQLAQRVIARYHLEALGEADTPLYVRHRLAVAGLVTALPFDDAALRRVHRLARGVPRRINLLCDRALLGAYAQGSAPRSSAAMVDQAAREVFGDAPAAPGPARSARHALLPAAGATIAVIAAGLWWAWPRTDGLAVAVAPLAAASVPAPAVAVPAMPASAAAPPAPLIDAAALMTRRGWADEDAAWRALAARWGDGVDAGLGRGAACDGLASQGLACHQGQGNLALLRQLDRPLWLALQLEAATPVPVLLTALDEREAELRTPDGPLRVSLATLTARWTGEFGTLWRRPPGLAPDARLGPGSAAFDWVMARLRDEQAGALPEDSAPTLRIQAFQRSQGLAVDGLAGPLTLMQLNRAAAVDEPRLAREP